MSRAVEQTFLEVRETIRRTARSFALRHGGDVEELEAEGNYHFLRAYQLYRPEKGPFDLWVKRRVYYQLLETARNMARTNARLPRTALKDYHAKRDGYETLVGELGEEAREVLSLVLERANFSTGKKGHGTGVLGWVSSALVEAGWEMTKIQSCFKEIKEALIT